nr:unnamed protein product [Callosobruchus chinensis]
MSTAECERCFSTLKRIKTFLRRTMTEDRLNALAVLSIEKKFVQSIPDFDNKVTKRLSAYDYKRKYLTVKVKSAKCEVIVLPRLEKG